MVAFSRGENEFLRRHELCALATLLERAPHVVPVSYLLFEGNIWIPVEYDSRKHKNVLIDDRVAVTVYTHHPDRGVMIRGRAQIVDHGPEFKRVYRQYHRKRHHKWKEKQEPFIKIVPISKASWKDNRPEVRDGRVVWTKYKL